MYTPQQQHQVFITRGLSLDLTRGKPSTGQLELADQLDGILSGDYRTSNGSDSRNYGGLDGIPDIKALGSWLLEVPESQVLAGGNASLTLMYYSVLFHKLYHPHWQGRELKFLCPVPGYDRHFSICQDLGIDMVPVKMNEHGPDMDEVEALIRQDDSFVGIWCVPKYQNPTGITYSDETVARIARLSKQCAPGFKVFWDNAYSVHHLDVDNPDKLANLYELALEAGTEDSVLLFGSTSKITHAGAGVSFFGGSDESLSFFKKHLGILSIGPDKVNQLRHAKLFKTEKDLQDHMRKHAEFMRPRVERVVDKLTQSLRDEKDVCWTTPKGGYFVTFYAKQGTASNIVALAAEAGVKLTPAGATHPYSKDPEDKVIRLAPSFPSLEELDAAMDIFCNCVKLANQA